MTFELSYVIGDVQYYESIEGELIGYVGGPIHKLNFFNVDDKRNLKRSLYLDLSIKRIYLNKRNKVVVERIINTE